MSAKQYAILFGLLIVILISVFAYNISSNLDITRHKIEASQQASAITELEHAITLTLDNVRQSADKISQWQEVKQQLNNPEIFAYWYSVRLKQFVFDLQKYMLDLMIYDVNGRALAKLDDNTLPYEINVKGIDSFSFRIINEKEIIYISPIYSDEENGSIIGYLSAHLKFLPLLKSLGLFQYIELDALAFHSEDHNLFIKILKPLNFSYNLRKAEEILVLEAQIRDSIISLILIIVITTLVLYMALIFIVGIPIKEINQYINRLRTNPEIINDKYHHSIFQVKELKSVYDSLNKYHTELTQNEKNTSLTLNSIGDAVIATDVRGNIVRMNPVAEKLTGWNLQEVQGQSLKTVFPIINTMTRKTIENPADKVLAMGETVSLSNQTTLLSKDGSEYQIEDSAAPIRDMNNNILGMVLVFNDVTERKQGELMMQNIAIGVSAQIGEAFFQSLTKHLAKIFNVEYVIIGLLDEHKENSVTTIALCVDGEIADNLSYDLKGTPCSHVIGGIGDSIRSYTRGVQQLFPDDHILLDMGAESYVGVPLVDANSKHIGLIVVMGKKPMENIKQVESILQIFAVRTVAEMQRLKTEETLIKSSKEWSYAMDFFEDAIYLIDLDDKLVRANRTFYQMTGLPPELAVGHDITTLLHPKGEEIPCPVCKARKERRDEVIVMEADHPDNPVGRPIQITVRIIRDNKGSPLSVLMGIRDLSNTRAAEEESAKLQHQLHQSQKMDALGKLTGGIAHDYNNMLGIIMGYSDLLQSALNGQPKLAKYAHEIYHAGERGARLTKKLLAFSRQKASEADCINLNLLLHSQQDMLEKTLTARIKLVFDLTEDLWSTWINGSEMEDVILNMSINAMHAIDGNGQLTIRTSNEKLSQMDAQSLALKPGDYVLLRITDTGCGMDEATREKIFEPFFSTKGDEGTGLGLSLVYGFVHSSGGVIKVYSELDHGTRFALYFPRHNGSNYKEQSEEKNNAIDIKGTETILVVDDEPALLSLSCEILAQYDFNVIAAENAKQALEILERETVDLLISDIIMPEMDGYQLAAIVKEKYPAIKIQLASGFADDRNVDMVNERLQQNLLLKPFSSQDLLQRIRRLLDEK